VGPHRSRIPESMYSRDYLSTRTGLFIEWITSSRCARLRVFGIRPREYQQSRSLRVLTELQISYRGSSALPKNSLSIEPSQLMLGPRTSSSAQRRRRAIRRSQEHSRFALSAAMDVRATSAQELVLLLASDCWRSSN